MAKKSNASATPASLLKCPVEMINEPALVDAVEDYNKLSGVPLITNMDRTATAVAISFITHVKDLSDEQADSLKPETIDLYNFLVTTHEIPADFIPSAKVFPTDEEVQKLKEKEISKAKEEMEKEAEAEAAEEAAAQDNKETKVKNTKNVSDKAPKAPKDRFAKFVNPRATTAVMMAIVDGETDAKTIIEKVSAMGHTVSNGTVTLMLSDVRKVLDYIEYKEKKANGEL